MNWFKRKAAGHVVAGVVKEAAKSNDSKTTILGAVGAGLLASQVDYGKAIGGDQAEIGKAIGAVVFALFGYFTNK